MISVTVQKAAKTLPELIRDTVENSEETLIVSDTGSVVLVDQTEWNQMRETLNLLRDKKSLRSLIEGHNARKQGIAPDGVTVDEAFMTYKINILKKANKDLDWFRRNDRKS